MIGRLCRAAIACAAAAMPLRAAADADSFKLTIGAYRYSDQTDGVDVNLRHTSELGKVGAGYYRGVDQGLSQWRAARDPFFANRAGPSPPVRLTSRGGRGGPLQADTCA